MSFFDSSEVGDDLKLYLSERFSEHVIYTCKAEKAFGAVRFWIARRGSMKLLSKVSLRIFATPVSSAASERNFSFVHRLVTTDRNRVKDDIIENLIYARSALFNDAALQTVACLGTSQDN